MLFSRSLTYPTRDSLKPVEDILAAAAAYCGQKHERSKAVALNPKLGRLLGMVAGAAGGNAMLAAGAAAGTHGAAALVSGLAAAGAIIGGGMAVGIGVVAAPVIVVGALGAGAVEQYNSKRLAEEKRRLLTAVDLMLGNIAAGIEPGEEAVRLKAGLSEAARHLRADLETPEEGPLGALKSLVSRKVGWPST